MLVSPGTSATPKQNFSWNYERAFTAHHRAWCDVTMPFHTLGDIQVAGEYLVYAIRTIHARAGRRLAVLGHSQGGMSMRWALRFWPDTRAIVDVVIGMAADNHGTTGGGACREGATSCAPASWQRDAALHFIAALNSRTVTCCGISYTNVFTYTDEKVKPSDTAATASASLGTGPGRVTNVATQAPATPPMLDLELVADLPPARLLDPAGEAVAGVVDPTSRRPVRPRALATVASTAARSVTSSGSARARPGRAVTRSSSCSACGPSRRPRRRPRG